LQQNTCTQKSMRFGLNCRTKMILEEICIHCTGSKRSPWACSAPKLPLVHPKRQSA
jgi:hypothetical protein